MSFKSDFPLFSKHPHLTYLDSASTSQKPSYVIDHIADYLSYHNSNIHRGIYDLAIDSEEFYQSSKKKAGKLINTSAKHIIYSYNATMCFNLLAQSLWQSQVLQSGDHVIVSIAEHHANIVPWQMLAKQDIIIDRVRLTDS